MALTFRKLRVVWTAGAVLVCLLPAISHGSDEVRYVSPKSPLVRVRHLASGLDIPFVETDGDTRGVMLTFPDGFVRDEYADAFEVKYRR